MNQNWVQVTSSNVSCYTKFSWNVFSILRVENLRCTHCQWWGGLKPACIKISFQSFFLIFWVPSFQITFSDICDVTLNLLLTSLVCSGWFEGRKVLGPSPQEQHGCQTVKRCSPCEGEPNSITSWLPWEGGIYTYVTVLQQVNIGSKIFLFMWNFKKIYDFLSSVCSVKWQLDSHS